MIDVKGKWTLVTGASRGIGYQVAIFMAKQGANLILHSRNLEHTKKVEQEVKALGVEVYSVEADLANHESVVRMLDEIEAKGTAVDILFNNAAIQTPYRENVWETPVADFEQSFQVNVISLVTISNRFIPKMIERGFGRIINTTSGIKDQPELSAYAASKAAVDKYTKDLAPRLEGTNVVMSITDPNWCTTDLGGSQAPNTPESAIPGVAVGAFVNDMQSACFFPAAAFYNMSFEEAVKKAESIKPNPYTI
ncbi:SDR family NAD(P)-dependent oxidoreductase [Bacillus alkalicellulosilyticus]|uniref:SDR family NAD(P)-dependent oxidoreductase n=1 Tax=Alkalihalobacterium alkalicellulosilyticum TaxID=1912214 RepID=UPI0009983855|nr:SDR family oxidoreductase [Bacillus alkalicellulosilyticus]